MPYDLILIFEQLPYILFMFTPSLKSVNLMTLVIQDLMCHYITPQTTGIFSNNHENIKPHTNEFGF
jgi:hypothetical protein